MNKYIAVHCTRKNAPRIEGSTEAPDLDTAIRNLKLWPYVYPDDFYDEGPKPYLTYEEAVKVATEHIKELKHGNGDDGYWNLYLVIKPDGTIDFAHNLKEVTHRN